MNNSTDRLKDAFDTVYAEEALKESARAYVARVTAKRTSPLFHRGLRAAVAAACIVLLLFAGYGGRLYLDTVSVISIDINPSIELGINAFDRVVSVRAYNDDGSALAEVMELRFLNCEDAVQKIVSSETVSTLLTQSELLTITVVGEDEAANEELCTRLEHCVGGKGSARCYSVAPQEVAEAHGCGLSYGKYLAYQEALKQDETLTPEDVHNMTMKEILSIAEQSCDHEGLSEETEESCGSGNEKAKHKGGHHE